MNTALMGAGTVVMGAAIRGAAVVVTKSHCRRERRGSDAVFMAGGDAHGFILEEKDATAKLFSEELDGEPEAVPAYRGGLRDLESDVIAEGNNSRLDDDEASKDKEAFCDALILARGGLYRVQSVAVREIVDPGVLLVAEDKRTPIWNAGAVFARRL